MAHKVLESVSKIPEGAEPTESVVKKIDVGNSDFEKGGTFEGASTFAVPTQDDCSNVHTPPQQLLCQICQMSRTLICGHSTKKPHNGGLHRQARGNQFHTVNIDLQIANVKHFQRGGRAKSTAVARLE